MTTRLDPLSAFRIRIRMSWNQQQPREQVSPLRPGFHRCEFDNAVDFTRVKTEWRSYRLVPAEHDANELD
jgi:hypothetical protein